jgi:V/A-type H+-transporting ATPase subunit K
MNARAILALVLIAIAVAAQTPGEVEKAGKYIGAGLAVGLAGVGAGIGVGIAGAAAISALVEKPEERIWYLIFIALAEAIAIYGLLISILLIFI